MEPLELVVETSDIEVYKGGMQPKVFLPGAPFEIVPNFVLARLIGSSGLLYDQHASERGVVTILDYLESIYNHKLRTEGFAYFDKYNSAHKPSSLRPAAGVVTLPNASNAFVRIHNEGIPKPVFVYGQNFELLEVMKLKFESGKFLGFDLGEGLTSVDNKTVLVNSASAVSPWYLVNLPTFAFSQVYVDQMMFDTKKWSLGIAVDEIDGGFREHLASLGLSTMTLMQFYTPEKKLHKQVVVYQQEDLAFKQVPIPTACTSLREEFYIVGKGLKSTERLALA